jgi:Fe-S cluster biogenesis protein NfuA
LVDEREVAAVIGQLQDLVAADGGAFELLGVDRAGRVSLRLRLDAVECLDCIVPPPLLADIVERFVGSRLPEVTGTELVDPRLDNGGRPCR